MWARYRPANAFSRSAGYPALGADGVWNNDPDIRSAGPYPASEPEVQAIRNFFTHTPPVAMISGHAGLQAVLYPWCYTPDPAPDQDFMSATAEKMRAAFQNRVQTIRPRARYYKAQNYFDCPSQGELTDWMYGRLGTHAYTVEVWARGDGNAPASSNWDDIAWWNENFPGRWIYLGRVRDGRSGSSQRTYDNVWIYYSVAQMRCGEAPPDQYIMAEGFKDCALAMAFSEPRNTPHPGAPQWMMQGPPQNRPAQVIPPKPAEKNGYLGNTSSRKFHTLLCYTLPTKQNRVYFATREAAIDAGYSPCGNCKP